MVRGDKEESVGGEEGGKKEAVTIDIHVLFPLYVWILIKPREDEPTNECASLYLFLYAII